MLKLKALFAALVMVMALVLTACNADTERTVFVDGALTVYRVGRDIRVTSATSGRQYNFTLRRTRRKESSVTVAKTIVKEDLFEITSIGSAWLIETPSTRTFIRW